METIFFKMLMLFGYPEEKFQLFKNKKKEKYAQTPSFW